MQPMDDCGFRMYALVHRIGRAFGGQGVVMAEQIRPDQIFCAPRHHASSLRDRQA